MTDSIRRVVTGTTAEGESCIVFDGPPPRVVEQPGRGLTFYELWATDGLRTGQRNEQDAGARNPEHHPPPGGTKFRIVEFFPDDSRKTADVAADLERIGAAAIAVANADPTFHKNETVDYNIILSGEIYAKTDSGEVLLKTGDVLIQRGTAHTWSNRSGTPCIYASIMVSAKPLEGND